MADPAEKLEAGARTLQEALESTGLTANAIGELSNGRVSAPTVRNYTRGQPYTRNRLRAIADVFGMPWGEKILRSYGEHQMADDLVSRAPLTLTQSSEARDARAGTVPLRNADRLTPEERSHVQAVIDAIVAGRNGG